MSFSDLPYKKEFSLRILDSDLATFMLHTYSRTSLNEKEISYDTLLHCLRAGETATGDVKTISAYKIKADIDNEEEKYFLYYYSPPWNRDKSSTNEIPKKIYLFLKRWKKFNLYYEK